MGNALLHLLWALHMLSNYRLHSWEVKWEAYSLGLNYLGKVSRSLSVNITRDKSHTDLSLNKLFPLHLNKTLSSLCPMVVEYKRSCHLLSLPPTTVAAAVTTAGTVPPTEHRRCFKRGRRISPPPPVAVAADAAATTRTALMPVTGVSAASNDPHDSSSFFHSKAPLHLLYGLTVLSFL